MRPIHIFTLAAVLVIAGAALIFQAVRKTVTLVINGERRTVTTFALTTATLLRQEGIVVGVEDGLQPSPDHWIAEGDLIRLDNAAQVHIWADDESQMLLTTRTRLANLLASAGITLYPGDRLLLNGAPAPVDGTLPESVVNSLQVVRSVPVRIQDGTEIRTINSAAATLGQALWEAGISLHQADRVTPSLSTPLDGPTQVTIRRAKELRVRIGGQTLRLRSVAETVGAALAEAGLALQGLDYSVPSADADLPSDGRIQLVRVREQLILEDSPLPFETVYQPDPELEIDNQRILEPGEYGLTTRRVRIRYEDGQEITRHPEGEWVAVESKDRVMGYGTKIAVRTLKTPDGPIEYWREVPMYATSYSPCRIFEDSCSSITASGANLQKGVAAVIRYWYGFMAGTQVYIPGYGVATILDIGGGIPGRSWIDLGYSDDDYVNWHRWVNVYFLTPVPSPDRILHILN